MYWEPTELTLARYVCVVKFHDHLTECKVTLEKFISSVKVVGINLKYFRKFIFVNK